MNLSLAVTSAAKSYLYAGTLNFTHAFKMILMRPGFSFNPSDHLTRLNLKSVSSSVGIIVMADTMTITRTTGSFLADGHVPSSLFTLTGSATANNNEVWEIGSISSDGKIMYVNVPDTGTIVNETEHSNGDVPETFHYHEFTGTITVDEELVNGTAGYATGGISVYFTTSPELSVNGFDFSTIGGTDALQASGGAIIYDDTSTEKYIVAYASFSKWEVPL